MKSYAKLLLLVSICVGAVPISTWSQAALDLFPDQPQLDVAYVRLGSWNLRHIALEQQTRVFLAGTTDEEDFAILTATFAKAIRDLGLDLVTIVEHQPRAGQPNRLIQIRDHLSTLTAAPWKSDETNIPYDNPNDPFGNLQFGLLWNSAKVTIDPNADSLLTDLRQPRNAAGELMERNLRVPWLIPVKAGNLEFDLLVLHLKSGGEPPQAAEVEAIQQYITQRQSLPSPRHLIVCGDWNIRPDQLNGRDRLRKLAAPTPGGNLMRVLTVEQISPHLDQWEALGALTAANPVATLLPFSHFNPATIDTLLDHIAISRTLDEVFDHPIQVKLSNGANDLRSGIEVAVPFIPEDSYARLTDHLPVVLTLRTTSSGTTPAAPPGGLRIVGAVPNPLGDDEQDEEVRLRNNGTAPVPLAGWKISDATGHNFWELKASDGTAQAGATVIVKRAGRPMALNNNGDTIVLINPNAVPVDQKTYPSVSSGQLLTFN